MVNVISADIFIKSNTQLARADIARTRETMRTLSTVSGNATKLLKTMGDTFKTVGKAGMMAFGGVTLAVMGTMAVVKDFNQNLTKAAAIAGLTRDEMNKLGDMINKVSLQYAQSSNNISAGVVELTKAGLSMEEISQSIDTITQAMLANNIEFTEAAKMAVFAVKQFGDSFADLPYLFDVIQKVAQETIMDFGDLQQALQYAGSTAVLAGVPFEQLIAIMGTLSQRAMEMGIASRSVNQMMMNLINSADEMQQWVDEMGLGVQVIKDGVLNLNDLINAFSKMNLTIKDLQKSSDIFTVRAMRSWGLLITGADEYRKLLSEDIPNSYGVLADIAERQTETITYRLGQFREILTAPLRSPEYIEQLVDLLGKFREPLIDISKTLYSGLWGFLQWTSEHSKDLTTMFSKILTLVFKIAGPLYNIGEILMRTPTFILRTFIYTKMLMSLGFLEYLKMSASLYFQHNEALLQRMDIESNLILIDRQLNYMINKKNLTELQSIKIDDLKLQKDILIARSTALRTRANYLMAQSYLSIASAIGVAALSAYAYGKAMGFTWEGLAQSVLTGAMTGGMAGGLATGGNPLGIAAGVIIGGGGMAALYYKGTSDYEEMPVPDMSNINSLLENVNYANNFAPSYTPPTAGTYTYGGIAPNQGTTVENNIYIGSVYGNDDLHTTINKALGEAMEGYR